MSAPIIVGISGKLKSGKDAIAARLMEHWDFKRLAFADALKEEVLARLPLTLLAIHNLSMHRGEPLPCTYSQRSECIRSMVYDVKPAGVRELLQEYGTGVRRADDDAYWTKRWSERAAAIHTPLVVPDVRFPNECEAIAQLGGVLWRVMRPGTEREREHESETLLDGWRWWDHVIVNDGTLADLNVKVDAIMEGR